MTRRYAYILIFNIPFQYLYLFLYRINVHKRYTVHTNTLLPAYRHIKKNEFMLCKFIACAFTRATNTPTRICSICIRVGAIYTLDKKTAF